MPSHSKAPPPPVFLTGNTLRQATGADAQPEISPDAVPETEAAALPADPPPGGWTLGEAARVLLPDLYAAASRVSPNAWMVGPSVPNRTERDALRRAFARIMEGGEYVAEGIREQKLETIPAEIWRAAEHFALGLPREPLPRRLTGVELCVGYDCWAGVRVLRKVVAPTGELDAEASQPGPGSSQQVQATSDALPPAEAELGKRRGGRPPKHDWKPFRQEVSRRLALDGGNITVTAFRKGMKEWAALHMPDPTPDDRTIERLLDECVPRDALAPD